MQFLRDKNLLEKKSPLLGGDLEGGVETDRAYSVLK